MAADAERWDVDASHELLRFLCQDGRTIVGDLYHSPAVGTLVVADMDKAPVWSGDVKVRDAHTRVVNALVEGGVDFFVIETQFSAKEAAMACNIARQAGLPIAINLTLKYTKDRKTGDVIYKTDWGHSPADLIDILASGEFSNGDNLIDHVHLLGLNCGAETRRDEPRSRPPF